MKSKDILNDPHEIIQVESLLYGMLGVRIISYMVFWNIYKYLMRCSRDESKAKYKIYTS